MAKKEASYIIRCEEVEVHVTPKRVKHLRLSVKRQDGSVHMTVPYGTSSVRAEMAVKEKLAWIRATVARVDAVPKIEALRCEDGASFYLFGEVTTLRLVRGETTCRREGAVIRVGVPADADDATCETRVKGYLRRLLEEEVAGELPGLAERIGVHLPIWHTRHMTSRWGSCVDKKRITINTRLVHYPRECLTYVLVHELCHIHVMAHDKRFRQYVETFYPNYRPVAEILKGRRWRPV